MTFRNEIGKYFTDSGVCSLTGESLWRTDVVDIPYSEGSKWRISAKAMEVYTPVMIAFEICKTTKNEPAEGRRFNPQEITRRIVTEDYDFCPKDEFRQD